MPFFLEVSAVSVSYDMLWRVRWAEYFPAEVCPPSSLQERHPLQKGIRKAPRNAGALRPLSQHTFYHRRRLPATDQMGAKWGLNRDIFLKCPVFDLKPLEMHGWSHAYAVVRVALIHHRSIKSFFRIPFAIGCCGDPRLDGYLEETGVEESAVTGKKRSITDG